MKKKVLFMIDSLTCGGAEKSLISLLPLLDYNKVDVDLLMVGRGGVFERYIPQQVNVIDYSDGCTTWWQKTWMRLCRFAFSAALRLNKLKRKPFNSPTLEWMTCHTALRPCTKKHHDVAIAYQQGFPCFYVMDKVNANRKLAWINVDITKTSHRRWFARPYYDRYDAVVAVSDALYDILLQSNWVESTKLHCVFDILNTSLIKQQSTEYAVAKSGKTRIVTVARLLPRHKGQDLALVAIKLLKEKGYDFRWSFVGDGPGRGELEQMARELGVYDMVCFEGMCPNPYPHIAAADIYVQTSRYEGFGLTLCEAKILGRPIVTTNFPTAFNQIEHEVNGLIVDMTAEAIAAGVERLLNDKALTKQLCSELSVYENTTAATESAKVMSLIMQ